MNTKELIDKVILYTEDTVASDAGTATLRAKLLELAQEVYDHSWNIRDFPWTMATTTSTITSALNYVALPADFQQFSEAGTVYNTVDFGTPMERKHPQIVQRSQLQSGPVARPRIYSLYIADNGVTRLQVPKLSNNISVEIYYKKIAPTLADTDHATNSNLQHLPVGYHYTVMLAGLKERAARRKGDTRASTEWASQYRDGLARMIANEIGDDASSVQRMPRAMVGGW